MARKPLPNDLAALHFLLSQVDKFLGAAETFRDKMRMQRSMIVRAVEAPETLAEYECFASHLKEEIDKAGAALVYPSKLLYDYLDDAEGGDGDDEGLELVRSPGVPPETAEVYRQLSVAIRSLEAETDSFTRLAGEILVKLAGMESHDDLRSPKLKLDRTNNSILFDDRPFPASENDIDFFKALIELFVRSSFSLGDRRSSCVFMPASATNFLPRAW